jgi:uncharacterized membrane protein
VAAGEKTRRAFMRWLKRSFLTGLLILLPTVITLYVLYRLFRSIDSILKPVVARYPVLDIPGLGFASVIVIILLVGVFGRNLIGKRIVWWVQGKMERLPMVNKIYVAIQQISEVFLKPERTVFKEVVFVQFPRLGMYSLAFVTSSLKLKKIDGTEETYITVFLPTSPNPTSGFLLMLPRHEVIPSDLSTEDALKMVISGGTVIPEGHRSPMERDEMTNESG